MTSGINLKIELFVSVLKHRLARKCKNCGLEGHDKRKCSSVNVKSTALVPQESKTQHVTGKRKETNEIRDGNALVCENPVRKRTRKDGLSDEIRFHGCHAPRRLPHSGTHACISISP